MTKKFFNAVLLLTLITYAGCNTDPLQTAVDDFALVVGLEDINSGLSIAVYDIDTGELIEDDVTIVFDEQTAANTIDIFSDPVDSTDFGGGFYNVGIRNEVVPTADDPFELTMTIRSDGYLEKQVTVEMTDTGLTNLAVDLYSENTPPDNIVEVELSAPLDADGNALPLPSLIDSTGQLDSFYADNPSLNKYFKSSGATPNALAFPLFLTSNGNSITYFLDDLSNFTGNPSGYAVSARSWNQNGETHTRFFFRDLDLNYPGNFRSEFLRLRGVQNGKPIKSAPMFSIQEEPGGDFIPVISAGAENSDTLYAFYIILSPSISNAHAATLDFQNSIFEDQIVAEISNFSFFSSLPYYQDVTYLGQISPADWFRGAYKTYPNHALYTFEGFAPILIYQYKYTEDQAFMSSVLYGRPKLGTTSFEVVGYGEEVPTSFTIQSHGKTMTRKDISDDGRTVSVRDVPLSHIYVTVTTPDGEAPPQRVNLTNHDGGVVQLTIPAKDPSRITSSVIVKLNCSNSNEFVRVDNIPEGVASIKYREANTTGKYGVAEIQDWNYSASEKRLDGATVVFKGVKAGTAYDMKITFQDNTETETLTIEGETFTKNVPVPDNFCSE